MKAQAGGTVPAVIPSGALRETVRFGFVTAASYTDPPSTWDGDTLVDEWRQGLTTLLADPQRQRRIRRDMVAAARREFAWSAVADSWEREFSG
jgi:glycosyltransferase involved in cell wall biosynthesis